MYALIIIFGNFPQYFGRECKICFKLPPLTQYDPLSPPGDTWTETLAYVLFWGTASVMTGGLILFNGLDFVDAPKLVQKEKLD